jgi:hypothetical protein
MITTGPRPPRWPPLRARSHSRGPRAREFYERGKVASTTKNRARAFPLMLIAGGGLNSSIELLRRGDPFDPFAEFAASSAASAPTCATPTAASRRPARNRSPVGRLHRRPHRPDGSPRHRQVHGARVLHRRPFIWNLLERAPNAWWRRCWRSRAVAAGSARLFYDNNMKGWGPALTARGPTSPPRWWTGSSRRCTAQPGLRLHGDARLRAELPDAGADLPDDIPRTRTRWRWKRRCSRRRRR